jgi:RNA recognition motif-containing protein
MLLPIETGNSLGYGFVKFETADSARAAISTLNGYALEGKRLKVGIARPPTSHLQTNLYVSGNLLPSNPCQCVIIMVMNVNVACQ